MDIEYRVAALEARVRELEHQLALRPAPKNQITNPYILAMTNHGPYGAPDDSLGWPFS